MKASEIIQLIITIIVLAFTVTFASLSLENLLISSIYFAVIFIVYIGVKKITAYYLQASVDTEIWHFQRYGFYERSYFRTPIPIGIILPFLLSILTLGKIPWLAATQTEILASKARVAKKHGIYRYSEMTDADISWINGSGIFACLILAIIAYFINLPVLSTLAVMFACFNMIPLGKLDGTKIFFGSIILWFILAALCLVGLSYSLFLV